MQLLDRRSLMQLVAAGAAGGVLPQAARAAVSAADAFTGDAAGLLVESVVIEGDAAVMVVDAQFTLPNARALADAVAATGKTLDQVFVTHLHPDHHFGLQVLTERFPDARVLAHPAIADQIAQTAEGYLQFATSSFEGEFPSRVIFPEASAADHLTFEGERIEILEPMHGDTDLITPLYIPALDTLVASDVMFEGTHLWVNENFTPEAIAAWRRSFDRLEDLGAGTIIPGHMGEPAADVAALFAHNRQYLDTWERAIAETDSREALREAMYTAYPDLALRDAIEFAVAYGYPA